MDIPNHTGVVYERTQKIEPEHVSDIMEYLRLTNGNEIAQLASASEMRTRPLINEAKSTLMQLILSQQRPEVPALVQLSSELPLQLLSYWNRQNFPGYQSEMRKVDLFPSPYPDSNSARDVHMLQRHTQILNMERYLDRPGNYAGTNLVNNNYYEESPLVHGLSSKIRHSSSSPAEHQKPCHYHYKGFCKYGANCRYSHGQSVADSFSQCSSQNSSELTNEGCRLSPLESLELELVELLKSRGGHPITIAMLPNVYHEKYGKVLQGDGYLTEKQRHGKAGHSLTRFLEHFSSIRLINRPHGQHSVILAKDATRDPEYMKERSVRGHTFSASQQIYLTFPPNSTFTEDDVEAHFKKYGPVLCVRIPPQENRMYGFVAFHSAETVSLILIQGLAHDIRGSRVLVKPYRDKTRHPERKHPSQHHFNDYGNRSGHDRKHLIGEHEQELELLRRKLQLLPLASRQLQQQPSLEYGVEELRLPEADHFSCQLDALNNGIIIEDNVNHMENNDVDDESTIELPETPFDFISVTPPL